MKKAIMIIMVVLMSAGVSVAEEKSICELLSEKAGYVMNERQMGIPMAQTMKTMAPDNNEIIVAFVVKAYEQPLWQREENIVRAINEFKNQVYWGCYKAMHK